MKFLTGYKKIIFSFLPVLFILSMIYFASSQTYDDQDLRPKLGSVDLAFLEPLAEKVTVQYAGREISVDRLGFEGYIEFFIRKGAHVVIFMVLAFFFYSFLNCFKIGTSKKVIITLLFIFLFASFDEYRHSLNPGRTGLFADVILDTFGGGIGTLLALLFQRKAGSKTRFASSDN